MLYRMRYFEREKARMYEEGLASNQCATDNIREITEISELLNSNTLRQYLQNINELRILLEDRTNFKEGITGRGNLLNISGDLNNEDLEIQLNLLLPHYEKLHQLYLQITDMTEFFKMKERILKNNEEIARLRVQVAVEKSSVESYQREINYLNTKLEEKEDKHVICLNRDHIRHLQKCIVDLNINSAIVQMNLGRFVQVRGMKLSRNGERYVLDNRIEIINQTIPVSSIDVNNFPKSPDTVNLEIEIEHIKHWIRRIEDLMALKDKYEKELKELRENDPRIRQAKKDAYSRNNSILESAKSKYVRLLGSIREDNIFQTDSLICLVGAILNRCTMKLKPACCSCSTIYSFLATSMDIQQFYDVFFRFLLGRGKTKKGYCCYWTSHDKVHDCRNLNLNEVPMLLMEPIICGSLKSNQDGEQQIENGMRTESISEHSFLCLQDATDIIILFKMLRFQIDTADVLEILSGFVKKAKEIANDTKYRKYISIFDSKWVK